MMDIIRANNEKETVYRTGVELQVNHKRRKNKWKI